MQSDLTAGSAESTGDEAEAVQFAGASSEPEGSAFRSGTDATPSQPTRRRIEVPPWTRAGAPAWIWLGIAVAGAGFLLIAVAWGNVAAEVQVHLQLPYVVSAGLVGLGLILVGLTILNIVTRQRDGLERDERIDQIIAMIEALRDVLVEQQRGATRGKARSPRRAR